MHAPVHILHPLSHIPMLVDHVRNTSVMNTKGSDIHFARTRVSMSEVIRRQHGSCTIKNLSPVEVEQNRKRERERTGRIEEGELGIKRPEGHFLMCGLWIIISYATAVCNATAQRPSYFLCSLRAKSGITRGKRCYFSSDSGQE